MEKQKEKCLCSEEKQNRAKLVDFIVTLKCNEIVELSQKHIDKRFIFNALSQYVENMRHVLEQEEMTQFVAMVFNKNKK